MLRYIVADPVTTTDLTLMLPSGTLQARMYTPVNHPDAPGIVVVHGVHYLGMDEPRLEAFATAMAACGLRVLTPELPDIKDYHIRRELDCAHWRYGGVDGSAEWRQAGGGDGA